MLAPTATPTPLITGDSGVVPVSAATTVVTVTMRAAELATRVEVIPVVGTQVVASTVVADTQAEATVAAVTVVVVITNSLTPHGGFSCHGDFFCIVWHGVRNLILWRRLCTAAIRARASKSINFPTGGAKATSHSP